MPPLTMKLVHISRWAATEGLFGGCATMLVHRKA
jgi:hypothetical protein